MKEEGFSCLIHKHFMMSHLPMYTELQTALKFQFISCTFNITILTQMHIEYIFTCTYTTTQSYNTLGIYVQGDIYLDFGNSFM